MYNLTYSDWDDTFCNFKSVNRNCVQKKCLKLLSYHYHRKAKDTVNVIVFLVAGMLERAVSCE